MQQNRPQSSAPRRPAAPRPVVIQPLEGRQLMSAGVVIETWVPFPAALAVEVVGYGAPPTPQAFGVDPGLGDGGGFWHGPASLQPPMASSPVTTVAVPVAAPVATSAVSPAPADVTASLPLVVDASAGPVAAPAVAVPAPQRDLLAAADGNDDASMAARAPAAAASLAGPASPAAVTTGAISAATVTSGNGPAAVATAVGDIVPTAVTTVARAPFAAVVDAPPAVTGAMAAPAEAAAPASSVPLMPVPGPAFAVPAGAPIAVPSFGETVIDSARASHPLALAVAAGAAAAVWMSTESARDRRREQLSQSVADAAALGDDRLIALGLFRG